MSTGAFGFIGIGVESSTGANDVWSAAIADHMAFFTETLNANVTPLPDESIIGTFDRFKVFNGLNAVGGNITAVAHPITLGYVLYSVFDTYSAGQTPAMAPAAEVTSAGGVQNHRFLTKTAQFQPVSGSDLPSLTFEVFRGPSNTTDAFTYYNMSCTQMELSIAAGNFLRVSCDWIGREHGRMTKTVPTYHNEDIFPWWSSSLSFGGNATVQVENVTFRVNNNNEGVPLLTSRVRGPSRVIRSGFRDIEVSGTAIFNADSEYIAFINTTERFLALTFVSSTAIGTATTSHTTRLDIDVPRFRYNTYPVNIGGPARIQVNFTGQAVYDINSAYTAMVTLTNSRMSAYSVNSRG